MYHPTTRLFAILELLQSRGHVSAQELAQALEVEERSVRRYIMMLRDIGMPIESERGPYGGYFLKPGYRLPPMMFNHEEVSALMVGLLLMGELGALPDLAIASAAAKIERVLPDDLHRRARALRQFIATDLMPVRAYAAPGDRMIALSLAALESRTLAITYVTANGDQTHRTISPYGVVLHGQNGYVSAYCHLRRARRIFRIDRIKSMAESEVPYQPADEIDTREEVLSSLASTPGLYTFEVRIHAPLKTVEAYVPASMAVLEHTDDETDETLMRCYSDDPYWLARYLAQLEFPFTVLQTDELRTALSVLAQRLLGSIR